LGLITSTGFVTASAAMLFDRISSVTYSPQRTCLVAIFFCLIPHARLQDDTASKIAGGTPIATVVRELGKDDDDWERIKFLAQQPAEATRLLVQELQPVTGVRILADEHYLPRWRRTEHVVWCLRALRGLTGGLDFRAKTKHEFGDTEVETNREWFTGGEQFPKDGTVHFFGVWMSRDSLYIAPRDAQLKIIQMWKNWYETEGRNFAYPPFKNDPDIWYF
jgi:hypothetical protein